VDFGLSNTYKENETLKTACGSPCYAAPEMIAGDAYHGAKVDIWSCGVILFAMVCGYLPFEDPDTTILYKKIMEGKFEIPNWVSEGCSDLINKILNIDPVERYTADQIVNHSWYTQTHTPVIKNLGLIIGKNKIPLE
jgi:5'-AMP-activated protein kinase catalytic alpha subunit|tara:strand:+ start:833 stop:1243 length:411 start_codon:yes stop_codon:yes gene_type:complete